MTAEHRQSENGTDIRINPAGTAITLTKGNEDLNFNPSSFVTEISYGQDVHRRIGAAIGLAVISLGIGALMALTKSKKHFIGLTWATEMSRGLSPCSVTRMITVGYWQHSKD